MNNINMELIYKLLINDSIITDETLKIYGYSKEKVDLLLENNIIERVKQGEYSLVSVDNFIQYGLSLLKEGKNFYANKCFEKCYKINPNDENAIFQYILSLLKRNKYEEVLNVIKDTNHSSKDVNYNLYLYLLNFLTEIPDEYREKAKNMTDDDLMLPMTRENIVENKIRRDIVENNFKFAYKSLNKLTSKSYTLKFEVIRELLRQVINKEEKNKRDLLDFAKKSQFEEIIQVLKEKRKLRYLGITESYVLFLAENIKEVLATRKISVPTIGNTSDMYNALMGKNFKVALELNDDYNKENGINNNKDILSILLEKLNKIIYEIKLDYSDECDTLQDAMIDKDIKDACEFAYYIKEVNICLEDAIKEWGLKGEQVLLIKLIYAKDYYIEGKILEGNLLVKEVEDSLDKSDKVLSFIEEVKSYRNNDDKDGILIRKRTKL